MAKIVSYAALFFAMAMIAIVASPSFSGAAFGEIKEAKSYDTPSTATTAPNVVCGNHLCAPGELPQHPPIVLPVKGIQ